MAELLLQDVVPILGRSAKTYWNLRSSRNPYDRARVAWIYLERDDRGRLRIDVDALVKSLLVGGQDRKAYLVTLASAQVSAAPTAVHVDIRCPDRDPRCRGAECERCLARLDFFRRHRRLPIE